MGGRLRALIRKELLAALRDPRSRMMLIMPPLLQLLIFSYAATLEVSNVSIGILNRDAGRWGVEFVERLEGSPTFAEILPLQGVPEIQTVIDLRQAIAVVQIGPEFSRKLEAGQTAIAQVVLDGRRSNAAQIVQGYLSVIAEEIGATVLADQDLPSGEIGPIDRNWFNPNLEYTWFTVPSLIGIITLLASLTITGLSVARERELGTFDQLMVSPLRVREILIGKTVPPMLVGVFQATIFVLAAIYWFEVPLRGSLLLLYASLLIYQAAVIGVGLFVSSLSQTQQQAFLGSFLFAVPAILLSGFASPVENMPNWLQIVSLADPLRYFLVIVKGIFLKAMSVEQVWQNTWPLLVIAFVTLGCAALLFTKRLE
ncbi:MAG: ABC transporter permease [Pseudomonadota bacterium]